MQTSFSASDTQAAADPRSSAEIYLAARRRTRLLTRAVTFGAGLLAVAAIAAAVVWSYPLGA